MRICERIVEKIDYLPLNSYLNLANDCLPKDMLWKIYLEIAGVAERKEEYTRSKNFITKAILSCPENVKWKCFVLGARMELKDQYPTKAKKIISKFIESASDKQRYHLLIEYSKICEFLGDLPASIQYFEETREYMKTEWKVYLEFIHMLARNNKFGLAYQIAKESLYHHNLAGRLWASLIQIKNIISTESPGTDAYKLFLAAINEVPKSGEVWCEGARICLNPYSNRFDIEKARQFLNFAIYFTPQYGDSFVEAIRLCYISGDKKELANLKKVN